MISTLVYRHNRFAVYNPPLDELKTLAAEPGVMLWVDLSEPTPEETKLVFEDIFAFHPLVIEDCVSDTPFPKLEAFENYYYLVMHAVDYSKSDKFTTTELDLILGKTFLVTYHRQSLRPVQAAMERYLRSPHPVVRGPDRYAHTLLDLMVDAYKPALEELREELEELSSAALRNVSAKELFPRVIDLRKELSQLRQSVRPQRLVVNELAKTKSKFVRPVIVPYLRDLGEVLERFENNATNWADQLILSFRVYLNKSSHEANQGIRLLTALTALTIPPLVISAWFGMNFARMPELRTTVGYPLTLGLTFASTLSIFLLMRRRNWF